MSKTESSVRAALSQVAAANRMIARGETPESRSSDEWSKALHRSDKEESHQEYSERLVPEASSSADRFRMPEKSRKDHYSSRDIIGMRDDGLSISRGVWRPTEDPNNDALADNPEIRIGKSLFKGIRNRHRFDPKRGSDD